MPGTYQYDVEIKSNVEKLLSDMKQVQDRLDTVEGKEYKIKLNVDEKKLSSVISNLEKMLDSLGKGTGDFKQFENLSKELSSVVSEVQSLSKAFGKVDDSGTKTLLSSIQSIDKSLSKLSQNILNVNKNMSNMGGNTSGTVKQVENISNAYQNAAKEAEKLADAQSKIGQKTNISSGLDSNISKYQEIVSLVKEYYELSQKIQTPKLSYQKRSEDYDRIDGYLLKKAPQKVGTTDIEKDINDRYHKMAKGVNEGSDFAIKAMRSAIQRYWSDVTEMPSDEKLLSSRKVIPYGNKGQKEEYIIPKKYQDMEKSVIQETIAMNKNNIAYEEERKQIEANNSALKERMDLIRNTIKSYDKNPDYNGEYRMGLSLKSSDKDKTDIFSPTSSISQEEMLQEICNMLGVEIPKNADKDKEVIKEVASATATTEPKKDAFPNADTKLDEAVTSAKDLDKTLEQVDIPTDSFDKVLEKLDRTKSELVDIVKITKQSVSDADGKFHDSYTLKDSRGSTEIYGVNSKTDKGQILRQNIVGYDKKKDELDISKAQLEVDKQLAKEEDNLAKVQQKKAQAFLKEQANYEEDQKKAELIKRQTLAYDELTDTISKYSEVAKRVAGGNADDGDLELMTKLEDKISQLQKQPILSDSQVSKSEKSLVSLYDQLDKIERKLVETNQKSQDKQIAGFDKRLESYTKKTSGYDATIARFNDGGWTSDAYLKNVQAVKDAVQEYETLLNKLKGKDASLVTSDDINQLDNYEKKIKDTIATVTNMSAAEKGYNFVSGQKELDKIHKLLNENSKMSSEAKSKIKAYYAEIESGNPSMSLDKIHGEILKIYNAEVEAGRAGRTLWDTMKHSGFHQIAAQMAGMFGVYDIINIFKQGANTLKEFDDGLTKISYTMDMTKSQLDGLGKSVLETANDIDSSIDNAMKVSQIYANMNTSAEEIKKLSEPTLILSNLTGFDASTVADDIQAVTQQFEISAEESMHIADVYDQISRNISVDYSKGIESIAEAVQVAGSTSKQAGKLKDLNVQKCA